jgi:nucleotide-binding universal stress UspA family protein
MRARGRVSCARVIAAGASDLIVLGTHGPEPIDRMLFGSTTRHVVRQAPCPVLTVRART